MTPGVDANLREQIRAKVQQIEPDENGCRLWPQTFAGGYAYVRINGKPEYAHKLVIDYPDGFKVARTCDHKACLELSHLVVVYPRNWIRPRLDAKTNFDGPIPIHRPELGSCWVWGGRKIWNGYGLIYWNGEQLLVHRAAYMLDVGKIPDGLELDHLCRNRACRRPDHLEPVTSLENNRRGLPFRVLKTHCPYGHPYSGDNLYIRPTGERGCLTCRHEHSRRSNERIKHARRS